MVEKGATQTPELKVFRGRDRLGPKAGVELERQVWVKVGQVGW